MHSELGSVYLLGSFALACVLACQWAVQLVFGAPRSRAWTQWVFLAAALTVAGILAADATHAIDKTENSSLAPIFGLAVCLLALLSLPLHVQAASLRLPARELILRPTAWLVLAWTIGASGWAAVRFYQTQMPGVSERAISPRPTVTADQHIVGVSDRGRPIALFHIPSHVGTCPAGFQVTTPAQARMAQTIIRWGGPSADSNCHGWVFTAGKYLLEGNSVPTILEDNGYESCSDPQPGDLIVYWSGQSVLHTGIVSGVLADGTVLIESKWNLQERFLHRPEDQPYSQQYSFYHTSRGSHRIMIQQRAKEDTAKASEAVSASQRSAAKRTAPTTKPSSSLVPMTQIAL